MCCHGDVTKLLSVVVIMEKQVNLFLRSSQQRLVLQGIVCISLML